MEQNMKKALDGKIAIITGGGRGLGRAIALGYAEAGASGIVITAARNPHQIETVSEEINSIAGRKIGIPVTADVTNLDACRDVAETTLNSFGRIDVLVNNAGLGQGMMADHRVKFYEGNPKGWTAIIDTNINGPFFMARAVIQQMLKQRSGRILNVTKSRSSMYRPNESPYGPSKAALEAMTLCWGQDLLDSGVTVNSIAPGGAVETEFVLPAVRAAAKQTGKSYLPADVIVPPAVWLASDKAGEITGCRFIGSKWDCNLPTDEAAEASREQAIFLPPERDGILKKTWEPGIS